MLYQRQKLKTTNIGKLLMCMLLNHQSAKNNILMQPAMTSESKMIRSNTVASFASEKVNKRLYENLFFTDDSVIKIKHKRICSIKSSFKIIVLQTHIKFPTQSIIDVCFVSCRLKIFRNISFVYE